MSSTKNTKQSFSREARSTAQHKNKNLIVETNKANEGEK